MKPDFGPSEWLDLLHKCQNGETTCMRTMQIIEDQTVPKSWVYQQYKELEKMRERVLSLSDSESKQLMLDEVNKLMTEFLRVYNYVYIEVKY